MIQDNLIAVIITFGGVLLTAFVSMTKETRDSHIRANQLHEESLREYAKTLREDNQQLREEIRQLRTKDQK